MNDIQQMFYQVLTNHGDQQRLRFLWRDNQNQAFQDCVMTVHIVVKTSFPCCANSALKQTFLDQKESVNKSVSDAVFLHKFYKDDHLDSLNDLATAVSTILQVPSLLNNGECHLTNGHLTQLRS